MPSSCKVCGWWGWWEWMMLTGVMEVRFTWDSILAMNKGSRWGCLCEWDDRCEWMMLSGWCWVDDVGVRVHSGLGWRHLQGYYSPSTNFNKFIRFELSGTIRLASIRSYTFAQPPAWDTIWTHYSFSPRRFTKQNRLLVLKPCFSIDVPGCEGL
jgi:hypothetical protein